MNVSKSLGLICCAALLSGWAGIASAQVVASDPAGILKRLQNYGYPATMTTDNQGDPKIETRVSDTKFNVYFYGCDDNHANCTAIQFGAGYDLKNGISALKINEWNRDQRFAKAYIDDESDPFLEMDVNMAADGVGEKNFEDMVEIWRKQVENFEDYIDW